MRRLLKGLFFSFLVVSFFSCSLFDGDDEKEEIKVDSASFQESVVNISVGEVRQVVFNVTPASSVGKVKVEYSLSDPESSVIALSNQTSNGLVITGVNSGNCVLMAKCASFTSYLQVNVTGVIDVDPYIVCSSAVYELSVGERKVVTFSLYGGKASDSALFEYDSSDPEVISINATGNSVVCEAKKSGFSRISVSHPKARYPSSVMVYSAAQGEKPCYITTAQNVTQIPLDGGTRQLKCSLVGSERNDLSQFVFKAVEGSECVDLLYNNNVCSVTPKKSGVAIIEVTHPDCVFPLQVQVVVVKTTCDPYLTCDNPLNVMETGKSMQVNCFMVGAEVSDISSDLSFSLQGPEDVISVVKVNSSFYVEAKKSGRQKIIVSHPLCENPLEIYFICHLPGEYIEECYVTTSQNVIKCEVGDDVDLSMMLVGGSEGDRNGFSWLVEDSSVIGVVSSYGTVSSARAVNFSGEVLPFSAVVTAKKVGLSRITVSHPKSASSCDVVVKVFARGTLAREKALVKGSGIIKVLKGGKSEYSVEQVRGSEVVESLDWSSDDEDVFKVSGSGLSCVVSGLSSGSSYLRAKNDYLSSDYTALVICGTEAELSSASYLYCDQRNLEVFKDVASFFEVSSTVSLDEEKYSCSVSDPSLLLAKMSGNVLVINPLKAGNTEVTVSHPDASNSLVFFVKVLDEVSIEYPYYFSYDKFLGIVVGDTKEYSLELVGAGEAESNRIAWSSSDEKVAAVSGNGSSCRIRASGLGEAEVTAHSARSEKDARVIVYTAMTEEELRKKVVISAESYNYLSYVGNDIFVPVSVSNPEENREKLTWDCDDLSVCKVDSNYDSAYIRCLSAGNCVITVSCGSSSVRIYVSVKETKEELYEKDIVVPSIVQALTGTSKVIDAVLTGLSKDEESVIEWSASDSGMLSVAGSGGSCYVACLKKGYCELMVRCVPAGIERKIQFVVADTYEELDSLVVIGLSQSYYRMDVGDYLNLTLDYGNTWPSDEVASSISWTCSDTSVVTCSSNGRTATLCANEEGIAVLTVSGPGIYNTLTVRIAVGEAAGSSYYISCRKMQGIVVGQSSEVEVRLLNSDGEEVLGSLSDFDFALSKEGIVSVIKADNVFSVKALAEGDVYLTVTHPLAKDARIYIYTALTQAELDSYYPLSSDKTSFLLSVGDSAVLSLDTIDDSKVSEIKWSCSNGAICSYSVGESKKVLKVTAKKSGSCNFVARHPDSKSDVVFQVYVTEYASASSSVTMLTESIVAVKAGEEIPTVLQTNLEDSLCPSLVWSSSKPSVARVEGTGKRAVITGVSEGVCEVTVKFTSTLYRTLVVYVASDDSSLKSYSCQNIDRRYSLLNVGGTLTLRPFYASVSQDVSKIRYEDLYQNNVVSYRVENGSLVVTGVNEGIASFKVSHPSCLNSYNVFIEVNDRAEVKAEDVESGYLSMVKNVYVLSAKDTVNATEVTCTPVGIDSSLYPSIIWTCDDDKVATVLGNGATARLFANKVGETVIRASSPYCSNMVSARVVVSEDEVSLLPYVSGDVKSREVKVGETLSLEFTVEGGSKVYPLSGFKASSSNENVRLLMTGNVLKVKGLQSGQSVVTVSHADAEVEGVSFVVSVAGVADNLIYLTTDKNYAVITEKGSQTLSVSLEGYNEINGTNYKWEVVDEKSDSGSSPVVSLTGEGPTRLCQGLNPGIARIKVTHASGDNSALYPVYISVKVCDYDELNPVYIKAETNVITMSEGERRTVSVELVNGSEASNRLFEWSNAGDESVLRLNSAGNQCVIEALKCGTGRITVSNQDCTSVANAIDLVVVVEPKDDSDMLYISTDSTLIEMSPSDSYKQVNVSLTGGTPEQNTLFAWEILSFESAVKNKDGTSNAVISMNGSQDSAIIKPLCEGVSVIRVTNSATRHYLDIKVMVTVSSVLKFDKSYLTVTEGETGSVDVSSPVGKSVVYESSNESVCQVSGTNRKCVIEAVGKGTCVIRAHTSDGKSSAELMVSVEKNPDVVSNYIKVSCNTLTLNTLDDVKGISVSASLMGTGVTEGDQDSLTWTMSQGGIVRFAGAGNAAKASGREIVIQPVSQGDVSIVVSHPKARNSRTLYVSVEQDAATLTVSSQYETMGPGDIRGLSCVLQKVAESELSNIVWATSDSTVVSFAGTGVLSDGSVRGNTCQIKANKEGSAKVTCSYGSITRNISVFVTEKESLVIPAATHNIKSGVTKRFKVECTPKENYDRIHIQSSSSIFADVKPYIDEKEKAYYIEVTGNDVEGETIVTVTMGDLSARMTVYTKATVSVKYKYYDVYDKNDRLVGSKRVYEPSNIRAPSDSRKVRVYYSTDPADDSLVTSGLFGYIPVPQKGIQGLMSPFFNPSEEDAFISVSQGEGYFDIEPKKPGYATLTLTNKDQDVSDDLPVCFYDDSFTPKFSVSSWGNYSNEVDSRNGIIFIVNDSRMEFSFSGKAFLEAKFTSSKPNDIQVGVNGNKLYIRGGKGGNNNGTRRSSEYAGIVTFTAVYPDYCGNGSKEGRKYVESYMVMQDVYE